LKFTLASRFQFDAAHTLDRSDSSRRVHGHTYFVEVSVSGAPGRDGMVIDLARLQDVLNNVKAMLDHQLLDDVPLLGVPTIEGLARFIFIAIDEVDVRSVKVWRADGGSCLVEATNAKEPDHG
jgi:6-pyruvoyltetrahydropterin/6-carboxytetrahydropterin synthase